MLFSFPFVFVRLSVDLLILNYLVMGMTNEENFDRSSSRPGSSTGGDDYGDRIEEFGKANVQVLRIRSMSRLRSFPNLPLNLFYFPNPNPIMLTVKIMRPSSISCASACSHC